MKIIVVDDELSALQTFLEDVVGKADIECRFFKDTEKEILAYAARNRIDAAFLDINMPDVSGIVLAKKLIAFNPEIKIVFITGLNVFERDLDPTLNANVLGILYKPYEKQRLEHFFSLIRNVTPELTVKTFGAFDCFIGGRIVNFSSQKAKELFALLIAYNGKSLTMSDAISQLWPDADADKGKSRYRDAVWRLRKTLNDIEFNCIVFQRAQLVLNQENIVCDYWEYLKTGRGDYLGEFLKSYDWSIEYLPALDAIRAERK